MSSDNQFTALGPTIIGFQTDGSNIQVGADIAGNEAGIRGHCAGGVGVSGDGAAGVVGSSDTGDGVRGETKEGTAVKGTVDRNGNGDGVVGSALFGSILPDEVEQFDGSLLPSKGVGVRGESGFNHGIVGQSKSPPHEVKKPDGSKVLFGMSGVFGFSSFTGEGPAFGVSGTANNVGGVGVAGFCHLGIGVQGNSTRAVDGVGVQGMSDVGYGGRFEGGRAPLLLVPAPGTSGPPTTGKHEIGELFVDSDGNLFLCKQGSPLPPEPPGPGIWFRIQLTSA
jgi:hypothetical protein